MNEHQVEELQTSSQTALDAEADAVPIPQEDNLSASQPGEVADTAAPGAPPAVGEITEEQAAEIAARNRPMVGMLVNGLADTLLPAWNITELERKQLVDSMSLALAYWWPYDTIPPKWMALLSVGLCGYSIANARRNEDGSWKPRKIVTVRRSTGATAEAVKEAQAIATGAPASAAPGGFSTSA